jgi:hypothetical protein
MTAFKRLIRVSMLVKRNPSLTEREFQELWNGIWGPLSVGFLKRLGFTQYIQVRPFLPVFFPHFASSQTTNNRIGYAPTLRHHCPPWWARIRRLR